jgi:hypothetical protein
MLWSRLLDLTPRPRHSQGYGGTWNAIIAIGGFAAGIGLLVQGHVSGLVPLAIATASGREGLLKYRAGNWP